MPYRWCVGLAVIGACGRFGFDARRASDGGAYGDSGDGRGARVATYLKASNTDMYDQFGLAVALSGDGSTLAVGAIDESSGSSNQADNAVTHAGAVYVFVRAGTTWMQQAYVKASNPDIGDQFGNAVALSYDGSTLAVGAALEDSGATGVGGLQSDNTATDAGAAYVFARAGTTWTQQAYIKASNTRAGDQFGAALALSGDGATLAVGAPLEDTNGTDSGAAYVYTRAGTTWTAPATPIKAGNAGAGDQFGAALALTFDGTTLAIGAPIEASGATGINGNEADNSQLQAGAVYVLVPSTALGTWTQQAYVKASTTITGDFFGYAIAMDGDTLAVGSPGDDMAVSNGGALYMFTRTGTTWSQQAKLFASNGVANDQFASAVALVGDTAIAGAGLADTTLVDAGAAYVFARTGTTWSQTTFATATNPGLGDNFGVSVGLASDGSFIAGAFREDSSTTGVNSQPDEAAMDSGAAYVFAY